MDLADRRARLVVGLLLVGLGVLFLAQQFISFDFWTFSWPFFIIVPGLLLLGVGVAAGGAASGLVIPGAIVTAVGLILMVQNATGQYQTWAYAWTLISPTAVGVGLWLQGLRTGNLRTRASGQRMIVIGLVMFVIFGAFFELVINISGWGDNVSDVVFPILLILVGVVLLVARGLGSFSRSRL